MSLTAPPSRRSQIGSPLSGTYYMDAVSNASIDVVTTASPYHETRHEFGLSADYVYRDAQITLGDPSLLEKT